MPFAIPSPEGIPVGPLIPTPIGASDGASFVAVSVPAVCINISRRLSLGDAKLVGELEAARSVSTTVTGGFGTRGNNTFGAST